MKLNLTENLVQRYIIPEGKRQEILFDFELSRFGVSVTARGVKSYVIVYRDIAGKQRQEKIANFGAITLSAARAVAKARLGALDEMKSHKGHRRSFCPTMDAFFFKTFFPLIKTQSRSYNTHASIYRNHIQQVFGDMRLDDITGDDVLAFNSALTEKPLSFKNADNRVLSDGTVKRIMILLRHILNEAIRHKGNTLVHNPTHVLKLKTIRKIRGRFLTREQLRALLKAAGESLNVDLPDIIRVMGTTGLRRDNVLAMRWEWFDADRGTLTIPAEADKAKKGFVLHISVDVRQLLSKRQDESDSDWVFPNPKTDKPYHSCRAAWVTACQKAGLPNLRMHDMRHTFASMMLDSGADIVDVQQALAHTQLKTTAVYLHLTEARKRLHANATSQATGLFA
ncbi:tyrosine-type recombinase/integrase [Castellaniella sp.]|uniref:tyrosine-type recombinase/integrase n=1 Tax=Castellaniella sp. TaxID=1955812 RepID=UPI002B000EC8|nr:tyrosine-type recombinase/integrase [Castellaniella sp.]